MIGLELERVHQVFIVQTCYVLVYMYLRLSVSAEMGLASSVTSASVGKWQILDAVSKTEEIVKGSARLGVPTCSKYNISLLNMIKYLIYQWSMYTIAQSKCAAFVCY